MRAYHVIGLSLVGIGILIAVESGCDKRSGPGSVSNILAGNPHRVVTISSAADSGSNPCEVDYPVTVLKMSKHHTIAWAAEDHDYWIAFDRVKGSPIGSNNIKVPKGTQTGRFAIATINPDYFIYAIYDVDPTTNPQSTPCKSATDDHDTGLNVKR
jgi:hypothetical protein